MIFNLRDFIEDGILSDIIKAEEGYYYIDAIGENSKIINKQKNEITYTFGYFQITCLHNYVMALARVFDKISYKNETRCLEFLMSKMINKPESFPAIIEKKQTENQLVHYGFNEIVISRLYNDNNFEFTQILGQSFWEKFNSLHKERKIIRDWRDKVYAHNDSKKTVDRIFLKETNKLLDFGWEVITLIGWAYLSTNYGSQGQIRLREEAKNKGTEIKKVIDRLLSDPI